MNDSGSCELRTAELADADQIRSALAGDQAAYARLIEVHQSAIGVYLWRFTRDPNVREELIQEVFVEAYFSLSGFRGDGKFEHWLKRIATRVGYRYWKKRERHRRQMQLPDESWTAMAHREETEIEANEAGRLVHSLLERLPPRDRLVLTLLYLQGHSVTEAAELAGWSRTMVKVQAFRARRKMQKLLKEGGHEPVV